MMLTFLEAKNLLNMFPISDDIQRKILLLFIGFGTPSANIIKPQCLKLSGITHYDDNIKTLWRLKLYNSNYSIIKEHFNTVNQSYKDLSDAAFYPYPHADLFQNKPVNIFVKNYLYNMFYNLDKFNYGEYGTPTANIIRNAIANNIIKYSK
jgi:hypothetical protein